MAPGACRSCPDVVAWLVVFLRGDLSFEQNRGGGVRLAWLGLLLAVNGWDFFSFSFSVWRGAFPGR